MEGVIATWYARNTRKNIAEYHNLAKRIAGELRPGDRVLELAPGPGYLAIELARLGPFEIIGLDVSRTFVRLARENALHCRVEAGFQEGNAAAMPFGAETFDFIVCRAAFKNFSDPAGALREMHRVLRRGGKALIIDMRRDAPEQAIAEEVGSMNLGRVNSLLTRIALSALRKRAYTKHGFECMARAAQFARCDVLEQPLGFDATLIKEGASISPGEELSSKLGLAP